MAHVFLSYVKEDADAAHRLGRALEARGISVWIDRERIMPGTRWRMAIRTAIREGAYFVSCFSTRSISRDKSYMNEELREAIDEIRKRPPDRTWLVPVMLERCELPEFSIGPGETLHDLQYVDLSKDWNVGVNRIVTVLRGGSAVADDAAAKGDADDKAEDEAMLLPERIRECLVHLADTLCEVTRSEVADRVKSKISVLREADKQVHHLCMQLYPSRTRVFDGMESKYYDNPGPVPLMFIPVSGETEELEQIASWSALYSNFTLFVTEHKLREFERIYQGGIDSSGLPPSAERVLALNRSQEHGLRRGACLFLPRSSEVESMTARESTTSTYSAPFHQEPGERTWFPLNGGPIRGGQTGKASMDPRRRIEVGLANGAIRDYLVYKSVILPHIAGASLATVIDIARNETDSFHRFNRYLRRAIRQLPKCRSEQGVREVLDEVDSRVADLRLEGERLLRLKALSGASLTFVNLSLSVLVSSDAELVRAVAGINAGSGFAELLKNYTLQTEVELNLRKSDFYFPFLVRTHRGESMFT